ncbi:DinB family protein [Hymenobacter tibetensis]|uniref:DinB family protein n=1 Tax=Hymenobacter tibetensis TaxID=497967 RepID=A0ABY4CVR0_9BACT|nr:DinB family protein [Hymenobacter tibetensis]UOG74359.1 DinB family protein [Hymenobacter tibetensis]
MTPNAFLSQLEHATRQLLLTVQTELAPLRITELNQQPAPKAWSILECLEHLNRYSCYYNSALAEALAYGGTPKREVRYSWLGRKFIAMMAPGNTKKAKTLKRMNPSGSQLGREVIVEFQQQQQHLLELLAEARHTDLDRKAVPVEFFKLLNMRLGETFEFVVLHEQRHVQQALRVKATLSVATATNQAAPVRASQAAAVSRVTSA